MLRVEFGVGMLVDEAAVLAGGVALVDPEVPAHNITITINAKVKINKYLHLNVCHRIERQSSLKTYRL